MGDARGRARRRADLCLQQEILPQKPQRFRSAEAAVRTRACDRDRAVLLLPADDVVCLKKSPHLHPVFTFMG